VGHPELRQVVEPARDPVEAPFGAERAHVKLVDKPVAEIAPARPACVVPDEPPGVEGPGEPRRAVRLPRRAGIGEERAAVQGEAVPRARRRGRGVVRPPPVVPAREGVLLAAEPGFDGPRARGPDAEAGGGGARVAGLLVRSAPRGAVASGGLVPAVRALVRGARGSVPAVRALVSGARGPMLAVRALVRALVPAVCAPVLGVRSPGSGALGSFPGARRPFPLSVRHSHDQRRREPAEQLLQRDLAPAQLRAGELVPPAAERQEHRGILPVFLDA